MAVKIPEVVNRFWQERTVREQRMLAAMAVVVLPSVLVFGILQPLAVSIERNRMNALRLEGDLGAMRKLETEAKALNARPALAPLPSRGLQTMIEAAMARSGFPGAAVKLSAEGDNGVRMTGEAGFDAWVRLAGVLERESQIRVLRLSVTPLEQAGHVKLDAVLVHAGGDA